MLTMDDVARLVDELPDAVEGERHGRRTWFVGDRVFAWDRAFSKADIKRYGAATPPEGPILAVSVADLDEKEAWLAEHPGSFFTIPHFDGFAAVLVHLAVASVDDVREALLDAWLTAAPDDVARAHLRSLGLDG